MTIASIDAASRAAIARPRPARTNPSPTKATYATLLLKASQLRSAAIDHQTVAPSQATRRRATVSRSSAPPPTGSVPRVPDPSPANIALASDAPTSAARTRGTVGEGRTDGSDAESMAGHASSGFGFLGRRGGYGHVPSNNSFTLPTPPAHPAREDSAFPFPLRPPREISPVTRDRSLHTCLVALVAALSAFAALSLAGTAAA